jgi:hypothetical protein
MKRAKMYAIIVGVKDHPMFVVLPYKTNSQRDKYFRDLEQRETITLPTDTELKVMPLRYIATATITHEKTFSDFKVAEGEQKDVSTSSKTEEG